MVARDVSYFPKNKLTSFLLAKHLPSTTALVFLHRLAPALHSGFAPMCHLEKPLELLGKEGKVEEPSWTVSRSRATPMFVPKRG